MKSGVLNMVRANGNAAGFNATHAAYGPAGVLELTPAALTPGGGAAALHDLLVSWAFSDELL